MRYATSRRPDALPTRPLVLATCCVATYNALESAAQRAKITLTGRPSFGLVGERLVCGCLRVLGCPRVAPLTNGLSRKLALPRPPPSRCEAWNADAQSLA